MKGNKIRHSGQVEVVHIVTSQSDLSSKKALGGRRMLTIIQSGVTEPNLWDNSFLVGGAEWVWGVWMQNVKQLAHCCIVCTVA